MQPTQSPCSFRGDKSPPWLQLHSRFARKAHAQLNGCARRAVELIALEPSPSRRWIKITCRIAVLHAFSFLHARDFRSCLVRKMPVKIIVTFSSIFLLLLMCTTSSYAVQPDNDGQCPPICDTSLCESEESLRERCPGGLVRDPCLCCMQCGQLLGDVCGGSYGYLGLCGTDAEGEDYECSADFIEFSKGANVSGICKSKWLATLYE